MRQNNDKGILAYPKHACRHPCGALVIFTIINSYKLFVMSPKLVLLHTLVHITAANLVAPARKYYTVSSQYTGLHGQYTGFQQKHYTTLLTPFFASFPGTIGVRYGVFAAQVVASLDLEHSEEYTTRGSFNASTLWR